MPKIPPLDADDRRDEPKDYSSAPVTLEALVDLYGLEMAPGHIHAGKEFRFLIVSRHECVDVPDNLPSIAGRYEEGEPATFFLVPANAYLEIEVFGVIERDLLNPGKVFIPEADNWPEDADIIEAIRKYNKAVRVSEENEKAKDLLEHERGRGGLYASAKPLEETTRMLIDGLMCETGVSVIFGDFDEFKTTFVLDTMVHVAMGVPWQGRDVLPRPVIWYALEGVDEIPTRVCALESILKKKSPAWGNDKAPLKVFDRIPENQREWRAEISNISERWYRVWRARRILGELPIKPSEDEHNEYWYQDPLYPLIDPEEGSKPVIVIDTLSLALGGEDEKGPAAAKFMSKCLDLLKTRPDIEEPSFDSETEEEEWRSQHPGETLWLHLPVASHVIIIHHQTKTGTEFAGHRAIGADTHGLYRVHRFGKITDAARPYAGQFTPQRVKGIPRPAPIRFEVVIVPVEGTKQTAAILKDQAATIVPKRLTPIVEALREQVADGEEIERNDLNACLDIVSKGNANAQRVARKRNLEALTEAGVLEPVEDDSGKPTSYRFHDPEP